VGDLPCGWGTMPTFRAPMKLTTPSMTRYTKTLKMDTLHFYKKKTGFIEF